MKAKTVVFAAMLSLAAAGTAQAQLKPFDGVYGKKYSDVTREQVIQDMQAARASGWLTDNQDMDNQPFTPQKESVEAPSAAAGANTATDNSVANSDPSGLASVKFGDPDNMPFQGS
jgi:hypothetical protein